MVNALSAELETACVRRLAEEWKRANWLHFRDRMRPPLLALSDSHRLGAWRAATRTIEIGRRLLAEGTWGQVIEVLKHEMAHQFVDEVLGARGETAHGETFRRVCERHGIDGRAAGLPDAEARSDEEGRVLARVAKLLALAGSPNLHEAERATEEAQRLLLKYNLDAVRAGARRAYRFRHLGRPSQRIPYHESILSTILTGHFFVEGIWVQSYEAHTGRAGRVLEICGTEANLDFAEHVYAFLLHTAERLWTEHRRASRVRGDRGRRSYLAGVMRGFSDQLDRQRVVQAEAGLVWIADADLGRYYAARHPRRRSMSSARSVSESDFEAGHEAGQRIVVHRPVPAGGGAGVRLLPARSGT